MAKQKLEILTKTGSDPTQEAPQPDQADLTDLERGNIRPTGVGLREGEIDALDGIGAALGDHLESQAIARNALIRIAVRSLLEGYLGGEITLDDLAARFTVPEKPKPKMKL